MNHQRIAVLGLGTMGGGMAARLVDNGFSVAVWNRNPAKAEPLRIKGAQVAGSSAEAAAGADVVLAMLADDDASRSVWLGEQGALAAMKPDCVAIESSTLTLAWVQELAGEVGDRGFSFLDAPVTGSKAQAHDGSLRFLVGGESTALDRARPALAAMSNAIEHLGPVGSATVFKLVNNFLCGVQVASMAEALAMVEASGMDSTRIAALLVDGVPGSPLLNAVSKRMVQRDYLPNFVPGLMAKDLRYAAEAFESVGIHLASAAAARQRFEDAVTSGYGDKDIATVVEPLRSSNRAN